MTLPMIVAVDMGFGHLRAAHSLARALGAEVQRLDRRPLASEREEVFWENARRVYEGLSRATRHPVVGGPVRRLLRGLTRIPELDPERDPSAPTFLVRAVDRLASQGLGRALVDRLRAEGQALLTTFYAPAVLADRAGLDGVTCVVTDTDIHRIWAGPMPARSRIRYCAPSRQAMRRLRAFGVPAQNLLFTGFPLPASLLGGPDLPALRRHLAARLVRLGACAALGGGDRNRLVRLRGEADPEAAKEPPLLTFAVGGAGAQAEIARRFLPGFRAAVFDGRIRLALVAGRRREIAERFAEWVGEAGLEPEIGRGISILHEPDLLRYFDRFDALLARTDALWTKPSELSFYAALGIPLILSPPLGDHEEHNRRWILESGAGVEQRDPRRAAKWTAELLGGGTLARAAWSGFVRLPKLGLYRILECLGVPATGRASGGTRQS